MFYILIVLRVTGYVGVISNSCQSSSNCTLKIGTFYCKLRFNNKVDFQKTQSICCGFVICQLD